MKITMLNKEYDINIQDLDLSNNQLQSLPAEIGNLRNLEKLYLVICKIYIYEIINYKVYLLKLLI